MKVIEVRYKEKKEDLPEWLYRKQMVCPVCNRSFLDSYPRYTRLRVEYIEPDLRPHYVSDISPFAYDVTVCFNCGYGMLTDRYQEVTESQRKTLRATILPKFQSRSYPLLLTREQAEERYKLAQLSGQLMNLKASEWGYFMLRCAWFYKSTAEGEHMESNEKLSFDERTLQYYKEAAENFSKAYVGENFPIRGMNSLTLAYLQSVLYYRIGDFEAAEKWLRECLMARDLAAVENKRIREKALELKDILKAEWNREEAEKAGSAQ